ncbi:MAG: hypothetical protein H7338_02630 [Candidatus Sericytochromatia bacterium]|nr:hypothetical protein [Candidatus Sericytochromatia bacterium]
MLSREKAWDWVNWYAAGGAVGAGLPWVPGGNSALLLGLESYMVYHVGKLYGETLSPSEIAGIIGSLDPARIGYRALFLEAMNLIPVLGGVLKLAAGVGIIKEIGKLVIDEYFEKKYPQRVYQGE